ncbi:MAG: single-stranded DNA-binding protein [Saprospiraceae bacterium]|nr:single-stranded DNA-binding protein [Saprospiraceae bacterium]
MVNKVTLIGNLGKDPEVRTLENGAKVATFTLATNENYKDRNDTWQTQTEWHNIVVWRFLAEKAERELKKGTLVYLEGKITHRKYQDKDGVDRYVTEVVANSMNSLEKRENSSRMPPLPTAENDPLAEKSSMSHNTSTQPGVEDDLPF